MKKIKNTKKVISKKVAPKVSCYGKCGRGLYMFIGL